jgi:hypothetical protein
MSTEVLSENGAGLDSRRLHHLTCYPRHGFESCPARHDLIDSPAMSYIAGRFCLSNQVVDAWVFHANAFGFEPAGFHQREKAPLPNDGRGATAVRRLNVPSALRRSV